MKKRNRIGIIITIGLMMFSFQVAAQKWKPLGNGIPKPIQAYYVDSLNNLYVAYTIDSIVVHSINDTSYINSKLILLKWDGSNWINMPGFTCNYPNKNMTVTAICKYNGELYLTGNFDSIEGGPYRAQGFVKYTGTNWTGIPVEVNGTNISSIVVHKNKLYISGTFQKINGNPCNNIACWDGIQWSALGQTGFEGVKEPIKTMKIINTKLYICPSNYIFTRVGNNSDTAYAGIWDESNWAIINKPLLIVSDTYYQRKIGLDGLSNYNNYLFGYTYQGNYLSYWNGTSWKNITNNITNSYVKTAITFKGQLWAVGFFKFEADPKQYQIIIWDGAGWIPKPDMNIFSWQSINLFELNGQLIVTGSFDSLDGVLCNNIAMLDLKVGKIGGKIYYDSNSNCAKDTNERAIKSNLIEIQPGNHYASTDENGKYEAYVDTGNITINLVPNNGFYKYWRLTTCNPLNYNVHVGLTTEDTNNNFGMVPFTNIKDIGIFLDGESGFLARPGRTESYSISYENSGTATITSGSVNLILDANVNLQTANPNYTSYTKPNASWTYNNLAPGEKRMINLKIRIDTTLSIYDTLKYYALILPTSDDADLHDNYDTLKQKIATAIDPNDKQCSPDGNILPHTSQIDYLIRFQNTGNYVAYRVRVVDTVSENLPMTKILLNSASHPYDLKVKDNVITWTFNDIMLPDSFTDEPNSHGYIRYTAYLKTGLVAGTQITNKAYIYFDYQQPVVTNSTQNIIKLPDNIEEPAIIGNKYYKVYPNPTTGYLFVEYLGTNANSEIVLFNSIGKEMLRIKVIPKSLTKIDTRSLPSGIYILRDIKSLFTNKVIVNY